MTRAERRKTHRMRGPHYTMCNMAVEQIGASYYDRHRPNGNPLLVSFGPDGVTCKVCRRAQ